MRDYPEDTIQYLVDSDWYVEDRGKELSRGCLVFTQVQFFSEIPFELTASRADPLVHDTVAMVARPLVQGRSKGIQETLPVAALPRLDGADCYLVNRSKKRPCLVLGHIDDLGIPDALTKGMSKHSTAQFVPVAPFFSVEQKGRAGYNPEFVERVKHASYPPFFWDHLPIPGGRESILRLDQIQPMGAHHQAYSRTGFRLSKEALAIVDEWLAWVIHGSLEGELATFRKMMIEFGG